METNKGSQISKKRILFFVPTFVTLSEKFIEREIASLCDSAHLDVSVVSLEKGNASIDSRLEHRVHYVKLSAFHVFLAFFFAVAFPLRVKKAWNIVKQNTGRTTNQNLYVLLKSLGYAVAFAPFRFDHLHCQFLSEPSTIGMLVSVLLNKEFSLSAHARDVFGVSTDPRLNAELVKEKAEIAKFISVCNKKAYDKCLELSDNNPKVLLRYHGVPLQSLTKLASQAERDPLQGGAESPSFPLILTVGRFVEKKGISYLIDAAAKLKEGGKLFEVKIIGYGPLYHKLLAKITEMKLGDCVTIVGNGKGLPNDEVINLLARAQIYIQPSVETEDKDAEGIPNALIEAAALAKPIITTPTGSISEVFENEKNALVVNQRDSEALTKAILRILDDETLSNSLGFSAKSIVYEKFDLDKNIKGLESLLIGKL